MMQSGRILVVGAGFAGSVLARELAERGYYVDLIDSRLHIGGNAYDQINSHGERIHVYGPHLLHGDGQSVAIRWLSRFTEWTPYEHRVRALLADGKTTPLPVNRSTLEDVFGMTLASEEEAKALLERERVLCEVSNADEMFLNNVGLRLTNLFFRPYTWKMWGVDASELEAAVGARLPVRLSRDDRYFTDSFQAMPSDGYTAMFERILDHERVHLTLGQGYEPEIDKGYDHTFLSVGIDEYFNYVYGRLPYRSIRFKDIETSSCQAATVINFTDTGPYTRVTQWDLIPNSGKRTDGLHTCTLEIPCAAEENNNERYYPVRNRASLELLARYEELASKDGKRTFIGRTGLFRYIDMVPCVAIHLQIAARFCENYTR